MYIEQILEEMKRLRTPNIQQFIPCTEEEVLLLEQQFHLSLPTAYKEFLRTMGKGSADFLVGSEFLYQDLHGLQEVAREMLAEDAFVFFMHQGYQFNFFRTSEGDNPPVYRYFEGKDQENFPLIYPHYTDFLLTEERDHFDSIQRRRKN